MNLLETPGRRRVFFGLLYFNEGAPIGFIWIALPTILRMEGIEVDRLAAFTSLLLIPWTLKFLWAPLVDRLATFRRGLLRLIGICQFLMGVTLLPILLMDIGESLAFLGGVLLVHALVAATQDVAIDALAIRRTSESERGRLNGSMQVGMILGRSLFGGGALLLAASVDWRFACMGIVAAQWCTMIVVASCQDTFAAGDTHQSEPIAAGLAELFTRRRMIAGLSFALVAGAGFEATGLLAGPWLIDRNISLESIGRFQAVAVPVSIVSGSLLGGWLADRIGHRATARLGLLGFVVAIIGLAGIDRWWFDATDQLFYNSLGAMYVFVGVFTVASYALFMDLANPEYGGTQFSAFMAGTNACEAWTGAVTGLMAANWGYGMAFTIMASISVISLLWLPAPKACISRDSGGGESVAESARYP